MKETITFFLFILVISIQAQEISTEEQAIIEYLRMNEQEQIGFLEKTVNINSGTLNLPGVKEVGVLYKSELDALGFETSWITMPDSLGRAGHLFAEINKGKGKTILLIGHIDTVFEDDHEFQSFTREGNIGKGPGANDMKGGNAVIIYALKALHAAGALEDMN
ncbi:MAG TPA: M20/M25/M40 family metallo-hydrolase, partial [Gillisia sp.]|nr:M20/M25/M40 family metallo-hydrolase [Gillisia sp.]